MSETRICTKCGLEKPISEFYTYKDTGKPRERCKACTSIQQVEWQRNNRDKMSIYNRRNNIRSYGITESQMAEILEAQNNQCWLCNRSFSDIPSDKRGRKIFIDHDHKTGKVRGLACFICNTIIGYVKENTQLLQVVTNNLKRYKESTNESVPETQAAFR